MDLIEANMDTKQTRDKPQMKIDYIKIRNRLKHNIECMSIEEFIHRVGERYTAYGIALLDGNGGKEENFVKQRLLPFPITTLLPIRAVLCIKGINSPPRAIISDIHLHIAR